MQPIAGVTNDWPRYSIRSQCGTMAEAEEVAAYCDATIPLLDWIVYLGTSVGSDAGLMVTVKSDAGPAYAVQSVNGVLSDAPIPVWGALLESAVDVTTPLLELAALPVGGGGLEEIKESFASAATWAKIALVVVGVVAAAWLVSSASRVVRG